MQKTSLITACLMAMAFTSAFSATKPEKQDVSSPLGGTTPSKLLNDRLDLTKAYKEIPVVSTKQFFTEYQANEAAADLKYKGKPFILKGYISRIAKDFMDGTYLAFWGDQYGLKSIDAHLFSEQICVDDGKQTICPAAQRAARLKKKEAVTLECFGSAMLIQTPQAAKCLLAP